MREELIVIKEMTFNKFIYAVSAVSTITLEALTIHIFFFRQFVRICLSHLRLQLFEANSYLDLGLLNMLILLRLIIKGTFKLFRKHPSFYHMQRISRCSLAIMMLESLGWRSYLSVVLVLL